METQLTEAQIESIKKIFSDVFDKDGSGGITDQELGLMFRSWGRNPSEEDLKNIVKQVDSKGNGEIDFPDFLAWVSKITAKNNDVQKLIDFFNKYYFERKDYDLSETLNFFAEKFSG